jgi:hypothetical protein
MGKNTAIAGEAQRAPDFGGKRGALGDRSVVFDIGRRDHRKKIDWPENRGMTNDRGRYFDDVARQHGDDRVRCIAAYGQPLGDERTILRRHFRQEMQRQLLVSANLVAVVFEVKDKQCIAPDSDAKTLAVR